MIELKNLHIGYSKTIISIEDMLLKNGELYILMGKNGSGKSTFIKTITGQIQAISGAVYLNKKNIVDISVKEIPKIIAYVGAKFSDVNYMTVREYISLGRSPYTNNFGKLKEKDLTIVDHAIEIMEISILSSRFTSELSDGEKQLVAIAKSIAQETDIIVLDEPTAFLDYSNKTKIIEQLLFIAKEMNKTIVLSSHDLELSLNAGCSFLIVNKELNQIQLNNSNISKSELIKITY